MFIVLDYADIELALRRKGELRSWYDKRAIFMEDILYICNGYYKIIITFENISR